MAFGDIRGTKTGTATSITASMPCATGTNFTVAVGDIIVGLLAEQSAKTVTACTDNLTNTYTALGVGADAGTVTGRGFYTRVTNAGTISSLTFTATASSNNCVTLAVGFEGPFEVSPLDANPTTIINDNTTPYTCPTTGTLAQADEKIVCAIVHNGNPTLTATSPNLKAIELATASILKAALGHQTVSSTASVTPAWTSSATPTASGYATVSFKKALTIAGGDGTASGIGTASATGEVLTGVSEAWNTYDKSANITLSNSDKTATLSSSVAAGVRSTQTRTHNAPGKYYFEFLINNTAGSFSARVGISNPAQTRTTTADTVNINLSDGTVSRVSTGIGDGWSGNTVNGDVICCAWDTQTTVGNSALWVRLNNGWWNDTEFTDPATGAGGLSTGALPDVDYALWFYGITNASSVTVRTETAEFSYAGPSGYTSWMGEALGAATTDGVGDADGVGTAAAVSEATKETIGTAAGVATASGVSPVATTDAVGTASGVGAATAVGEAFTGIPDAWSAADKSANITLSNNDKTATLTAAVTSGVRSTTKYLNGTETQKFYVEFLLNNVVGTVSNQVGLREASASLTSTAGSTAQCASNSGNILTGNATVIGNIGGSPLADGDIICMAYSPSTERIWFRKNSGLWNNDAAANPATNINGLNISVLNNTDHGLFFLEASTGNAASTTVRTELADLTLTAPSGFVSWMGEALGAATSDAVGDADGVGTASATGAQTAGAPGAASGIGTAAADGRQVVIGIAASAGTGAATAQGAQTAGVAGTAAGIGTASSQGAQTAEAQGTAAGTGTAAGFSSGAAIASGAGAASGTGLAAATGYSIIPATANAAGVGAATAAGAQTAGVGGSAVGVGTASAQGAQFAAGAGNASGIGNAVASSSGAAIVLATGTADGVAAATAGGAKFGTTTAQAAGVGTATATGRFFVPATAAAVGVGAATASGAQTASTTASASGVGTATATGGQVKSAQGAAAGVGAATAVGVPTGVATSAGTANGIGAASAISGGASLAAAAGSSTGTGTATATGRTFATVQGNAAGVGAASSIGRTLATVTGTAAGIGTATATAHSIVTATASSAAGVGIASAVGGSGAITVSGAGASAGNGAAAAIGAQTASAAGAATGVGTANSAAEVTAVATGSAAGTGTAAAIGGGVQSGAGTAAGSSTATATAATKFLPPLAKQVIVLGADNRQFALQADNRTITADIDNRTITVEADNRMIEAEGDDRAIEPEGGGLLLAA